MPPFYRIQRGDSPLVAAAIHDGHAARPEVAALFALAEPDRLREEDPFTGGWTVIAPTGIVGGRSRFEVDLNRPRDKAVYLEPADAWGLHVWKSPPDDAVVQTSLEGYDDFYAAVEQMLRSLLQRYPRLVVFDLHSYNHRRQGPDGAPADPQANPDVNIGTGTMDRPRWAALVDRVIHELRTFDFLDRRLDVRENVKFFGGQFPRWIHQTFPDTVCCLAIEFKKFFMDEWTGEPDPVVVEAIREALGAAAAGVLAELASSERHSEDQQDVNNRM